VWTEDDPSHMLEIAFSARGASIDARYHLRDPQLDYLVRALALGADAPGPRGAVYRDGITRALVARLQMAPPPSATGARLSPAEAARVTQYIDAGLGGQISLAALASLIGASPSHARAMFRRAMGMPLHAYIVRRRVQRAVELLSTSDRTLASIAFEVGFAHQSHLTRWVRRFTGHSPSRLRRSVRE
jgi:AraC family transcriptional regulator